MRSRRLGSLGLVFVTSLSLAGCEIRTGENNRLSVGVVTGRAEDTWTRSYAVIPGARVELLNVNGRIDAEATVGSRVEVVAHRSVRASTDDGARALLERMEMREEVSDARVRIEVRPPRLSGLSGQEMTWALKVPKGVHVDVRSINGRIQLTGLDGDVHAETTNGGVTAQRLASSAVEASSVNGGVVVELTAPLGAGGHVELETVNGGVSLDLPADSAATISARTVNGRVSVSDLDLVRHGEESRRRVEGTLNGGGARVSITATNGGVTLRRSGAKAAP